MRNLEKLNALALSGGAGVFAVLALTPFGARWEPNADVRDVYLWIAMFALTLALVTRRADLRRVASLDGWMLAVWLFFGVALFGLAPLWPVLLLSCLLGAIVRLEAKMAFQAFDELQASLGLE